MRAVLPALLLSLTLAATAGAQEAAPVTTSPAEAPASAPAGEPASDTGGVAWSGSGPSRASSSSRQVRQKSSPNGVRWMLRRTTLANFTECIAARTSGWASTTWYSSGSRSDSRENHTSPSRKRLLRYDGTWSV